MPTFDADALTRLRRVGALDASPDGRWLAVAVERLDDDAYVSDLWRVPTDVGDGNGVAQPLTDGASKDDAPCFGPAGVYFLSDRAADGSNGDDKRTQVWLLPGGGGAPRPVTDEPLGVVAFALGGDTLVVLAEQIAGVPLGEQRARAADRAKRGPSALHYTDMPVRHWDRWRPDTHLHAIAFDLATGDRVDLTPDAAHELRNLHKGPALDVSSDGAQVAVAWSRPAADRNFDAWVRVYAATGGAPRDLGHADCDGTGLGELRFTPDGATVVATRATRRRGKADLTRLVAMDVATGAARVVSDWDAAPHLWSISRDGASAWVTADDDGCVPAFRVELATGAVTRATGAAHGGSHGHLRELPDGRVVGVRHRLTHPPEPFACDAAADSAPHLLAAIAGLSDEEGRAIAKVDYRTTPGDGGTPIAWFSVAPNAAGAHRALLWIHGGPISMHIDGWHWRWNALVGAAAGYVVALPNPRGSTGHGQAFMDGVQGNAWGAACYRDLMAVTDALARDPAVDPARLVAMGGSFGGYMANWIGTQTDRFRAIVTHASIFDLRMFHGTTDYPAWFALEMGTTPDVDPDAFQTYSPHAHVASWKTPTLVLHGEKDYRVPIGEGLLLYEALRLRGVLAELVVFPDENHWILKPRNIRAWYQAWIDFVGRHV